MIIVNLTKHAVNIYNEAEEEITTIHPSGLEARIETETVKVSESGGIPFFEATVLGRPYVIGPGGTKQDMPLEEDDIIYIVSGLFRSIFDRPDLYQPGRLLRNEQGQPVGCIGLSR